MKSMINLINFCTSIFKDQNGCFKFYHHQHAIYYIKKRSDNQDRFSFFSSITIKARDPRHL